MIPCRSVTILVGGDWTIHAVTYGNRNFIKLTMQALSCRHIFFNSDSTLVYVQQGSACFALLHIWPHNSPSISAHSNFGALLGEMDTLEKLLAGLPQLNLEGQIIDKEEVAEFGGSSDLYKAWSEKHGTMVAVKRMRVLMQQDKKFAKVS